MAAPADPGWSAGDETWVAVGVIRGAFGVQGALKVEPYADVESSVLNHVRKWRIQASESRASGTGSPGRQTPFPLPADVTLETSKQHGGSVIATIEPSLTREQALSLKGSEVFVRRLDFPVADIGEYYWTDLIGCRVSDTAGASLGVVAGVDDHGAQSLLRLDNGILIPFVSAFVLEVATAEKRIVADWSADWV